MKNEIGAANKKGKSFFHFSKLKCESQNYSTYMNYYEKSPILSVFFVCAQRNFNRVEEKVQNAWAHLLANMPNAAHI